MPAEAASVFSAAARGMAWAQEALDPAWRGLIARAASVRKGDAAQAGLPADPSEAAATRAFATYAIEFADRGPNKPRHPRHKA